jgi:hypothetical protein
MVFARITLPNIYPLGSREKEVGPSHMPYILKPPAHLPMSSKRTVPLMAEGWTVLLYSRDRISEAKTVS